MLPLMADVCLGGKQQGSSLDFWNRAKTTTDQNRNNFTGSLCLHKDKNETALTSKLQVCMIRDCGNLV